MTTMAHVTYVVHLRDVYWMVKTCRMGILSAMVLRYRLVKPRDLQKESQMRSQVWAAAIGLGNHASADKHRSSAKVSTEAVVGAR